MNEQVNDKSAVKVKIQKFGSYLSGMVMPNKGIVEQYQQLNVGK